MISLIKFFFLAAFTVFLTVVVFRYMRTPPNHQLSTPFDALIAAVAVDRRNPGDSNREIDERSDQVLIYSTNRERSVWYPWARLAVTVIGASNASTGSKNQWQRFVDFNFP